jgi:hypothetical protein
MSTLEGVAAIVGALAWPLAVVVGVFVLREPLRSLLRRLSSYDGPVGKLTFGEQLEGIEELDSPSSRPERPPIRPIREPGADEVEGWDEVEYEGEERDSGSNHQDGGHSVGKIGDQLDDIAKLAAISPPAAVLAAWRTLEASLVSLYRRAGEPKADIRTSHGRPLSPLHIIQALSAEGVITRTLADVTSSLRHLRNEAVHKSDSTISEREALGYADLALSAASQLDVVRDSLPMPATRVFISFDYDNDARLKDLLVGQSHTPDPPFEIVDWSIKVASPGWKAETRRRIRASDTVAVICGEFTHRATGVAAEVAIAQEENIPYFLLNGYTDKTCTKPTTARQSDKLYKWTWPNLNTLVGGGRFWEPGADEVEGWDEVEYEGEERDSAGSNHQDGHPG